MKAWIDEEYRALVEVPIANHAKAPRQSIQAWIDTAFDGQLVLPKSEIERLGLGVLADTDAVLADGSTVRLRCYFGVVEWLEQVIPVQVIENSGSFPLVGTALLSLVDLRINYRTGVCTMT